MVLELNHLKTLSNERNTSDSLAYLSTALSYVCLSRLLGVALSSHEGSPKIFVSIGLMEMTNKGDLLDLPALSSCLSSLLGTAIDTKTQELLASATGEANLLSVISSHLEHKLAISRRRVDASSPSLVDIIRASAVSIVAPIMRSSKRIGLILAPGDNITATKASNRDGILVSDCADTHVSFGPEVIALIADSGVPLFELLKGDAIVAGN